MEMLRVRDRPVGSAHPLRRHDVRNLLGHTDGRRGRGCDEPSRRVEYFLLPIDAGQALAQSIPVEAPLADRFQPLDEPLERRRDELQPVGLDELSPAMPRELPPAWRQRARPGVLDLEELGAERFGPEREDAMNAVA